MRTRCSTPPLVPWLGLLLTLSAACSNSDQGSSGTDPSHDAASGEPGGSDAGSPSSDKAQSFVSDLPAGQGAGAGNATAAGGAGALGGATAGTAPATDSAGKGAAEAERAIVEADIVQVSGSQLYALSRVAGLSVVDVSDPHNLKLLGSYRKLSGTPFEMYLESGVAIVMFSDWGQYTKQTDGSYSWVQTSKVIALDVKDPAGIKEIGSFDVAGQISDSRRVGDVMYVVGYQNGYCWSCEQNKPKTSVLSLNVKDPRAIRRVDELSYASPQNQWGGGQRSISVTTQRIYVGGPEYGPNQPTGSTIQVVDISDPNGDLVAGGEVKVAGQISSRWQMDEYDGVLRVISQPWPWATRGTVAPAVQTFKVESSQKLTALARVDLQLPPNETLQSVRFDGPRGYAVTAVRTDPLYTIDLSNPAQPKQLGEVVMPGYLYYMEPRGNRLIGLGYDQGNAQGAITVSLFDVTNLATPRMLSRVNFGGSWANLPEDQDRIHKSFKVLDALGLILVPFSGSSGWTDTAYCYSSYRSGVQLVDFANDALTARGVAPSRGEARRAQMIGDKTLLAISDEAVDTFDLTNRAAPSAAGRLTLARNVSHALPLANGHVARINQDWYAQNSEIDIVALNDADKPSVSAGSLNLSAALHDASDRCSYDAWIQDAYASGNQIVVTYTRWNYSNSANYSQTNGVLVIDASTPSAPSVAGKLSWTDTYDAGRLGYSPWTPFYNFYNYGYVGARENVLHTDAALVTLEQRYNGSASTNGKSQYDVRLRVVDLRDPKKLSQTTLALPQASGYAGLVSDGANMLLSHYDDAGKGTARFYVDRLDLSDPQHPSLSDKLNVPGALMHYDRNSGRALTTELTRVAAGKLVYSECAKRFAYFDFSYLENTPSGDSLGTCTGYLQKLQLVRFVTGGAVLDDTHELGDKDHIGSSSMGDGRVVAILSQGSGWYGVGVADGVGGGVAVDCFGPCGSYGGQTDPFEALVLGGFDSGSFQIGRVTVDDNTNPWWGWYGTKGVYAHGTRALVLGQNDAIVLDVSDVGAPKVLRTSPLYGYPQNFAADGDLALLALGMNGVQRVDL